MSAVDELLVRHAALVQTGLAPDPASIRPRLRLAVITCMDSRIDMFRIFGLREGDAHVLRNAGGLVTDDMVRSLILSQRLLGTLEAMIVQHTNCGLEGFHDAELLGRITAEAQQEPPFTFGGFDDVEESVRTGMERVQSSPWLPGPQFVRGFVYDVHAGKVREVQRDPQPARDGGT